MAGLQLTGLDLTKQENMLLFVCPKTTESALYNTVVLAHWGWGGGGGVKTHANNSLQIRIKELHTSRINGVVERNLAMA